MAPEAGEVPVADSEVAMASAEAEGLESESGSGSELE